MRDFVKMIQDELNKGFAKYLDTKKYHPLNSEKLIKLIGLLSIAILQQLVVSLFFYTKKYAIKGFFANFAMALHIACNG